MVVDASAAYLQRQGLDNLADGAALMAADAGAEGPDVYAGGLDKTRLVLVEAAARARGRRLPVQHRRPVGVPRPHPHRARRPLHPLGAGHGARTPRPSAPRSRRAKHGHHRRDRRRRGVAGGLRSRRPSEQAAGRLGEEP